MSTRTASGAVAVPPARDAALLAVAVTAVSTSAPLIAATAAPALAIAAWRNLMAELSPQYRVVAIDTRGYNLSDKPDGVAAYAMPNLVGDVEAVIKAEGRKSAIVVGHDWGAAIAWNTVLTKPGMVDRHDVLASIIQTAARSAEQPSIGGASPTVLVSVRASDLESGRGVAHADGVGIPVSLRAARHLICAGGIQTVILDDHGAILQLGSQERCFTPAQRRAITLRDGGCLIPGCSVPASWCEIHHVIPDADGGPTHPDNGVLVCWFHHRTIDTSGWEIRMIRGAPQIRPPQWLDPDRRWRPATKSPTRLADQLERQRSDPAA